MFVSCPLSSLSFSLLQLNIFCVIFSSTETVLSEIINIFLDAQSNGGFQTGLTRFLSGDWHSFLFETRFPRFHFFSFVSNISGGSSSVTNFRSFFCALLLDFKVSQDFVFGFLPSPFLLRVCSVIFSRPLTSVTTGQLMAPKIHFYCHSVF